MTSEQHSLTSFVFAVPVDAPATDLDASANTRKPQGWHFWLIIISLCMIVFVVALDGMIIAIALPLITRDLGATTNYIWIANSFALAQTVVQPPCAQLCNIFGRRWPMLISV